jgi:hypothetical protein
VKLLYLHKRIFILIEYEAEWNPETICLFWRTEKSLAAVGIRVNNSDIIVIFQYAGRATQARQVSTEEPDKVSHSDREGGAVLSQLGYISPPSAGAGLSPVEMKKQNIDSEAFVVVVIFANKKVCKESKANSLSVKETQVNWIAFSVFRTNFYASISKLCLPKMCRAHQVGCEVQAFVY